jgi:cephalosporin-C deacetylase-like acetyl esterase
MFIFCLNLQAQVLKVTPTKTTAVYAVNEPIQFRISSTVGGQGTWEIYYESRNPQSVIRRGTYDFTNRRDTTITFTPKQACVLFFKTNLGVFGDIASVAVNPLDIQPIEEEPTDFDAFWNQQKQTLATVPMNPVLTLISVLPNGSRLSYLQLNNVNGRKVQGYIAVPSGSGKFPGVILLPPFGDAPLQAESFIMTDFAEKCKAIVIYLSAHNTRPDVLDPNAYKPDNNLTADGYYNRFMVLGGLRAIEYLTSRTDYNGNLGVTGMSQGAGWAIMLAGLNANVKACMAINPASGEQMGWRFHRASGFPIYMQRAISLNQDTNVVKRTAKYHDIIYFMRRYRGQLMVQTGYEDDVTPAATQFAAYNQHRAMSTLMHMRDLGHTYPEEYWFGRYAFFKQHLTGFENPFTFKKSFALDILGGDRLDVRKDTIQVSTLLSIDGIVNSTTGMNWAIVSRPANGNAIFSPVNARRMAIRFTSGGTYVLRVTAEEPYLINDPNKALAYTLVNYITVRVSGVGTEELDEASAIQVLPNPALSEVLLIWQPEKAFQNVRLFNMLGQVVLEKRVQNAHSQLKIDISHLAKGTYQIELTDKTGKPTLKRMVKS